MIGLGIGPMSGETIEATFKYSELHDCPLMLIASKNQIDYSGGYVNNWSTRDYMKYIAEMRSKYPGGNVKICRDHCGLGFTGTYNIEDVYRTILCDIDCGFDLIHMDFCHFRGKKRDLIKETIYAIQYAQKLNPAIEIEIGTDEVGKLSDMNTIRKELEIFLEYCNPTYYVVNTGALVKENLNVGSFNVELVREAKELLNGYHVKLKEHNADYLNSDQIKLRKGLVDAMNVAPEFGFFQTAQICSSGIQAGLNDEVDGFLKKSFESGKWTKWIYNASTDDYVHLGMIAGHYNYMTKEYEQLYNALTDKLDIHTVLIDAHMGVIARYAGNTKES